MSSLLDKIRLQTPGKLETYKVPELVGLSVEDQGAFFAELTMNVGRVVVAAVNTKKGTLQVKILQQ